MNKNRLAEELLYEKVQLIHITAEAEPDFGNTEKTSPLFKRLFDIAVSLTVIVLVLSWMLPLLAIMIKMNSRGPVFFIQKRVGVGGKIFYCLKLRTMYVNRLANIQQAQANDPRITTLGKFLRLSCLDELPQFFNVLVGDMSIVGPRPHMLRDCKEFSSIIKNYHQRNMVKPGITGMAQVKGYRGITHDFFDVAHRYKWDMFYVRNCSFRLDMQIMRLTISYTFSTVYDMIMPRRTKESEVAYQLDSPEYLN